MLFYHTARARRKAKDAAGAPGGASAALRGRQWRGRARLPVRACLRGMAAPPRPARHAGEVPAFAASNARFARVFRRAGTAGAAGAGLTSGARWATMIDGSACPAPRPRKYRRRKDFYVYGQTHPGAPRMPRNLHPHPSLAVSHPAVLPHRAKRLRLTAWRFPQGAGISAGACSRCRKAGVCADRALLPGRKELFPVLPPSAVCRLIQRSRRRNGGSHHETGSFVG